MSEIEIIAGGGRLRYWPAPEKVRIVEETLSGTESVSVVARRSGVAPNLLFRWRRLMLEGGTIAVQSDDSATANRTVRQLEDRVRVPERLLGRKTLEVEILKEALEKARAKKTDLACAVAQTGRYAVSTVKKVMDVSRSNLHERLHGRAKPRRSDHKAQDAAVLPLIKALVAKRPTARSPTLPVRRAQRSDTRPVRTTGQRPAWRARRSL